MPNTKAFFNKAADAWQKRSRSGDRATVELMLQLSDLGPGLRILDAGCGAGFLEPFLLALEPERVFAVDYAENMVRLAKAAWPDPRIEYVCQDLLRLSPRRYACDFCVCFNAFPHFEEQERLAAHLGRLIRPGGRLTICHTQGKRSTGGGILRPGLPAQGLINTLSPYFRLDALVDNNVLLLVSGISLGKPNPGGQKHAKPKN